MTTDNKIFVSSFATFASVFVLSCFLHPVTVAVETAAHDKSCSRELENANSSLTSWAQDMEQMIGDAKLTAASSKHVYKEANFVLDQVEEFGSALRLRRRTQFVPGAVSGSTGAGAGAGAGAASSSQPVELARRLVALRRRANMLALSIYLETFDLRWPQASIQLATVVERVQQACLDRQAIRALEAPPVDGRLAAANTIEQK